MNPMTANAVIQSQRRGIRRNTLQLILQEGDRRRRLPGNAFAVSLSRAKARELGRLGIPAAALERVAGVVAVVSATDGAVITVEHRTRRFHDA